MTATTAWLRRSEREGKKWVVTVEKGAKRKTLHFGQKGASDYTVHKDPKRMQRYLSRHSAREDWGDPFTAGFWSRWILWSEPQLSAAILETAKRFDIKVIVGRSPNPKVAYSQVAYSQVA